MEAPTQNALRASATPMPLRVHKYSMGRHLHRLLLQILLHQCPRHLLHLPPLPWLDMILVWLPIWVIGSLVLLKLK